MSRLFIIIALFLNIQTLVQANPNPSDKRGAQVVYLTEAEFRNKIMDYEAYTDKWEYKGTLPCMVDFYASWCGPCKRLAPVLEELASAYAGQLIIYKVDVDQSRNLSAFFGVKSIPTLLFCPMEGEPSLHSGAPDKDGLIKAFDSFLLKKTEATPAQ